LLVHTDPTDCIILIHPYKGFGEGGEAHKQQTNSPEGEEEEEETLT
jgi:hypothetical protein